MAKDRVDVRIGSLSPTARAALQAASRRSAWVRAAMEHFTVCQSQPAGGGGVGPTSHFEIGMLRAAMEDAVRPLAERLAALEEAVAGIRAVLVPARPAPPPQPPQPRIDLSALAQWAESDGGM